MVDARFFGQDREGISIEGEPMAAEPRSHLLEIYQAALAGASGRHRVREALEAAPMPGPVTVIALGKAAAPMARGALEALGEGIEQVLIVTKTGHDDPGLGDGNRIVQMTAGHPLPDAASLEAGAAVVDRLTTAPAPARFLLLISGGTSSLVEMLPPGVDAQALARVNEWLLASGWPIGQVNAVRSRLSCIKAGRLLGHLDDHPTRALLISDVPGDDPAVIGSGLLTPPAEPPPIPQGLPAWLHSLLDAAPPIPQPHETAGLAVEVRIVAGLDDALGAAARQAQALGYAVHRHERRLAGDALVEGGNLGRALMDSAPGIHLWGGETTVTLPAQPGRGGRNQALALAAATELQGRSGVGLLAAGTDGTDGPTQDAGALVDGGTVQRGALAGLDAEAHLRRADAGTFLEAAGDLVYTGPTETNVTDLVIGYAAPS